MMSSGFWHIVNLLRHDLEETLYARPDIT
jgi:hypothetical protein